MQLRALASGDLDDPETGNLLETLAVKLSIGDIALVPFYSWLAKTFTFCDHHFSTGTNSTSGHLLAFTGQTPTFKNPPFTGAHPVWDVPTSLADWLDDVALGGVVVWVGWFVRRTSVTASQISPPQNAAIISAMTIHHMPPPPIP